VVDCSFPVGWNLETDNEVLKAREQLLCIGVLFGLKAILVLIIKKLKRLHILETFFIQITHVGLVVRILLQRILR
jgi:hypothetical protein